MPKGFKLDLSNLGTSFIEDNGKILWKGRSDDRDQKTNEVRIIEVVRVSHGSKERVTITVKPLSKVRIIDSHNLNVVASIELLDAFKISEFQVATDRNGKPIWSVQ